MSCKTLVAATLAATLLIAPAAFAQNSTANLRVIGLTTDSHLVSFGSGSPRLSQRDIGTVFGLSGGDTFLIGIDFRIQDSQLYGVGNAGGVYLLNTSNATALLINRLALADGTPVALQGTRFGVDFNPAADRLRVVSDSGQNLRHNVNPGGFTVVDGELNNGAVPPVVVAGVTSIAYSNNDVSPDTGTLLFDVNATAGALQLQLPANAGTLSLIGTLGFTADAIVLPALGRGGFDIYTQLDRDGHTVGNAGFAALTTFAGSQIYSIDLSSGLATDIGSLRTGTTLVDLALPPKQ